jgi:hypothetical protein
VVRKLRLVVGGLTALAAFLLVTAMACDDGEGESTPSATPTPGTAEVQEQLRQMVLQLEDLPVGVILAEEFFSTNGESAASSDDPAGRLAMLEEWGRILGYEATYQANPEVMSQVGLLLVYSTASLYESEEGARASFADGVETARTTDWTAQFGGGQDVQVEEMASAPLTDEMLWMRITGKVETGEEGQKETLAQDVILFRQGPARASLMIGWDMDDGSSDFMQQLAEAQAQNLKDTLP